LAVAISKRFLAVVFATACQRHTSTRTHTYTHTNKLAHAHTPKIMSTTYKHTYTHIFGRSKNLLLRPNERTEGLLPGETYTHTHTHTHIQTNVCLLFSICAYMCVYVCGCVVDRIFITAKRANRRSFTPSEKHDRILSSYHRCPGACLEFWGEYV